MSHRKKNLAYRPVDIKINSKIEFIKENQNLFFGALESIFLAFPSLFFLNSYFPFVV